MQYFGHLLGRVRCLSDTACVGEYDECGVCNGDNSFCEPISTYWEDCAGDEEGHHYLMTCWLDIDGDGIPDEEFPSIVDECVEESINCENYNDGTGNIYTNNAPEYDDEEAQVDICASNGNPNLIYTLSYHHRSL